MAKPPGETRAVLFSCIIFAFVKILGLFRSFTPNESKTVNKHDPKEQNLDKNSRHTDISECRCFGFSCPMKIYEYPDE